MKYIFSEEQYKEIRTVRQNNKDKQIDRRLRVLELRCEGKGLEEIAALTDFHRSHVSSIIRQYFEKGISAISEKHYPGNRRNMSLERETEFMEQYLERAELGQLLDVREIAEAYEQEVGHKIGNSQIYRVMHRQGWRKIMPRSRHPKKASDEAIEASKKLTGKPQSL